MEVQAKRENRKQDENFDIPIKYNWEYVEKKGIDRNAVIELIGEAKERQIEIKVPSPLVYSRWQKQCTEKHPSLMLLIEIARKAETNISFLLGLTDKDTADDKYEISFNLKQHLENAGLTRPQFVEKMECTYGTIQRYTNNLDSCRLFTLLKMCKCLNCSLDYLLGLTAYKNWEDPNKQNAIFEGIAPGTPLHIISGTFNSNCIVSQSGDDLLFPDGTVVKKTNPLFAQAVVRRFIEE